MEPIPVSHDTDVGCGFVIQTLAGKGSPSNLATPAGMGGLPVPRGA